MVKAELNYNPYLLETNIKFNGKIPRINSLVEKYQTNILQIWIDKIPTIFYDEMNGYHFELEFSGTKLEYENLKQTFFREGVTEDMVQILHKNELGSRKSKLFKIEELLKWLQNHPNHKFDFSTFMEQNVEFFYTDYVCVFLNGITENDSLFDEYKVVLDIIEETKELDNTKLKHTPIIIQLDTDTLPKIKENLDYFFHREDISTTQLFFMISPVVNSGNIERILKELKVQNPQIIANLEDVRLRHYLEIYPITDYIIDSIKIFQKYEMKILEVLDKEKEKNRISNGEIYIEIDVLENMIEKLQASIELFKDREPFDISKEMLRAQNDLNNAIQNWKSRKTKIVKESEAIYLAHELEELVQKVYQEFCVKTEEIFEKCFYKVICCFQEWYKKAECDVEFQTDIFSIQKTQKKQIPKIFDELMSLKEEKYVTAKTEEIFSFWRKSQESEMAELVTTFYCWQWRNRAMELVEPLISEIIQEYEQYLNEYTIKLAGQYEYHLEELIKERKEEKEHLLQQLSEDELELQSDSDWFAHFQRKLRAIERE